MEHTLWNNKALLRLQFNRAVFQIDEKAALNNEEELIIIVVFVPMIFALHHPQPNNRVVYFSKRLVVPAICTGRDQRRNVNKLQLTEVNVEMSCVRVCLVVFH